MGSGRATDTEKAYWKKVEAASAQLEAESVPATSMVEVFERMAEIRRRLGFLAGAGLPADDDLAIAENLRVRDLLLQRDRRGT